MAKKLVDGQLAAFEGGKVGGQVASNLAVNFPLGKYRLMAKKPVDGQLIGNLAALQSQADFRVVNDQCQSLAGGCPI